MIGSAAGPKAPPLTLYRKSSQRIGAVDEAPLRRCNDSRCKSKHRSRNVGEQSE